LDQTSEHIKDAPMDSNLSSSKIKKKQLKSPLENKMYNPKSRNSAKVSGTHSKRVKKTNNWASDKNYSKRKMIKKKNYTQKKQWK
jgi:hypothetical protein